MLTKDFDSLENILEAVEKIEKYSRQLKNADELFEDDKTFDAEEVWQIIKNNIPELKVFIQNILK